MKTYIKRFITFSLAMIMLLAVPLEAFANNFRYYDIPSEKYSYINSMPVDEAPKFINSQGEDVANEEIKDPAMPALYTLRADFKIQRGGDETKVNDQPYIATVGENATDKEKAKVNKDIFLKEMDGYTTPTVSFNVNYDYIKTRANKSDNKEKRVKDSIFENSYVDKHPYTYKSKQQPIEVKHVFQSLYDKSKYGGLTENSDPIERQQYGETGHNINVSPLPENERLGFAPETSIISTRVPENLDNFFIEYRYNREKYNVVYDTDGGTPIPARTLYFGQTIPKVDEPTKVGAEFQGWKVNQDIEFTNESGTKTTIKAGNLIADKKSEFKEAMPAHNLKFTAVWQEKPTAKYTILYYTEKPDHEFGTKTPENRREKYDYVGARVIEDAETGSQPNLETMLPQGVTFPDLEGKSSTITNNKDELSKYYTYNAKLTENANEVEEDKGDGTTQKVQKKVLSTGETVYEVYYDRTVYTLIFEKAKSKTTFDPEITVYDTNTKKTTVYDYINGSVDNGTKPYTITARFGESLANKWVRDGDMGDDYVKNIFKGDQFAYISKGYSPKRYSQGWCINQVAGSTYRDTPPYRLTKSEFIDANRTLRSPSRKDASGNPISYTDDKNNLLNIISLGIAQSSRDNQFMPHHIDFELEDIDGTDRFHPELYYWKSDTDKVYRFDPPKLKGFTEPSSKLSERGLTEQALKAKNNGRDETEKTPFAFQNTLNNKDFSKNNGYISYRYQRNSYTLNLNSDPTKVKEDAAYVGQSFSNGSPQSQEVKYQKPLADLELPILTEGDEPEFVKIAKENGIDYEFKGWAVDPSGVNMIQNAVYAKDGSVSLKKDADAKETMPDYNMTLYGIWGEKEPTWTLKIDPNEGRLRNLKPSDFKVKTNLKDKAELIKNAENEGSIQVFDVKHRTQIENILTKPERKGYDFLGWELVRFNKDGSENRDYYDSYKVPELYAFGNDVVSDIYLRAIWVENRLVDMTAYHHFFELDENGNYVENTDLLQEQELVNRRIGSYTSAVAREQGASWTLMTEEELANVESYQKYKKESKDGDSKQNTFFQVMRVDDPLKEEPVGSGTFVENPDEHNEFHFYYRAFKTRKYKVNYMDERIKDKMEAGTATAEEIEKYRIIPQELVENGNIHYDARNYRSIPGWKLTSDPQQQLFFDLNEKGELVGINGKTGPGSDEINFYYKDVRVIERKDKNAKTPDGYVRVIFQTDPNVEKKDRGGSFGKDAQGKARHEVVYDVIEGLLSDNILVPQELKEGETAEPGKLYIIPDPGKSFIKWDHQPLLNASTVLRKGTEYVFTAYFDWKDIKINELVRTEAYKEDNGTWVNNFAPTIEELKAAIRWYNAETKKESDLPAGVTAKIIDTTDEIYNKVREMGESDKDELVRTININAKVDFGNGYERNIQIPVKIYKNVYEALTSGDKPKVLADAEKVATEEEKQAGKQDGDLVEILKDVGGEYVKVTINPTGKPDAKDSKIYYVNPKAWVDIKEIKLTQKEKDKLGFTNWTADKIAQNEDSKENGVFDFDKRHKFTEDTIISPGFAADVVPQEGNDKPKVPENYVKVIVDKTDKADLATDEKQQEIFWVNPTKEVTIGVTNPTGKTVEGDQTKGTAGYTMQFSHWKSTENPPREWNETIVGQFTNEETTIIAKYSFKAEELKPVKPELDKVLVPKGKTPTEEDYKEKITPPEGKTIKTVTVVEEPDVSQPGEKSSKITVEYNDGTKTTETITVKVVEPILPAEPGGRKPEGALENYVKVNFVAGKDGEKVAGSLEGQTIYYVSPEVEVNLTEQAEKITKTPAVGYTSNGGSWTNADNKNLNGIFKEETTFVYNFLKSKDIVEKTNENPDKPEGYVTVIFRASENGKLEGNVAEKTYYVNPKADIKLKVLGENETAGEKELAVPKPVADANYGFEKWVESLDTTNSIKGNLEYVAHFTKGKVTLNYNANGGSGDVPEERSVNIGEKIQLANQGNLTKENENFIGWKFDGEEKIYKPGETITLNESKTAIAQWSTNSHTVRFETMGGSQVPDQSVKHGETLGQVTPPTFGDKVFMGWKENENDANYFNTTSTPINEDKTLIAIWQDPVQEIDENDKIEDEFIKVTFEKGSHGEFTNASEAKTYKVAKGLTYEEAKNISGVTKLVEPRISADNYYKFKAYETIPTGPMLTDQTLIASYELEKDVVPLDPEKGDYSDKPEEMVLVEFVMDKDKADLLGPSKYYVKKDAEVKLEVPTVVETQEGYRFGKWEGYDVEIINEPERGDIKYITAIFAEDTNITDTSIEKPSMRIQIPRAGESIIVITEITPGAKGRLILKRNGNEKLIESSTKKMGRRRVETLVFDIGEKLQRGDIYIYYADKNGIISESRTERVR
ncbi:InlB B-repeat-containing protein [Peptoniphilus sp. MSJ-1]|uniref:InlB B-repeat-containing protein n=1 Tax=Peptoniphilus ovalis TaxID=2841503 RepID=A0ABS6FIC2_9FIRM|nr:InlB B-repeat-containing protein [Peptoniphilus ovalis]MBU5669923.1 InlB B-repeat-containing protein [Peptoniphilus ovalis]